MKFIDWFSGIGGFRRGLELAGHECIGFCEIDKFAVASYTSMHLITEKQRAYLETLPLKQRQKEILKEEYRNGEWYAADITRVHARDIPRADIWTFGSPCQSFSMAGKREGLDGKSGLIREIFRLLNELPEEDRPEWLIYENVKGMLSSNKGWDYAAILSEMDGGGYDVEWQNINSAWFVPQNRERIYTIGHNRRYGSKKIFPVQGTDGENNIRQIGPVKSKRDNPNRYRVYDSKGVSPCLSGTSGGGRQPYISFMDLTIGGGITLTDNARTLNARYGKGPSGRKAENSGVFIGVKESPQSKNSDESNDIPVIWNKEHQCYIAIRKLTPKECFRLQGVPDEYFDRAAFVNSDNQLFKQAGNSVTVPVIKAIGEGLRKCE